MEDKGDVRLGILTKIYEEEQGCWVMNIIQLYLRMETSFVAFMSVWFCLMLSYTTGCVSEKQDVGQDKIYIINLKMVTKSFMLKMPQTHCNKCKSNVHECVHWKYTKMCT